MIPKRLEEPEWRGHVERFLKSGLSADEYAHREELKPQRLRWWKQRLAREARERRGRSAKTIEHPREIESESEATSFVRLVVREPTPAPVGVGPMPIEVVLRDSELVIRVVAQFDETTLLRLVSLLRSAG